MTSQDLSSDNISEHSEEHNKIELAKKKDENYFRKWIFIILVILLIVMFAVSYYMAYEYIFHFESQILCNNIDLNTTTDNAPILTNGHTGNTIIITMLLMIPTVLSLALLRFLFGGKNEKEEKNIPSVVINVGKELVEVVTALIKK